MAAPKLPFTVDRNAPTALVAQIVDGVLSAIRAGTLKPGDRLPPIQEMAAELEVSHLTIRHAFHQLADLGEVVARRRSGIHIKDSGKNLWSAHVLLMPFCVDTYYFSVVNHSVQSRLNDAGIRTSWAMINGQEYQQGLPHVKAMLDTQHVHLGVIFGSTEMVGDEFTKRGIPLVALSSPAHENGCVARVEFDHSSALHDLAAHCRAAGTSTATVLFPTIGATSILPIFEAAGLSCRALTGTPSIRVGGPEDMEKTGYELTRELFTSHAPLPDLLYFSDDYLCRGGLVAILESGVRVPAQLQIASHSNRGNVPVFPLPLTRIEVDPRKVAETVVLQVTRALGNDSRPLPDRVVASTFVPGKTTRAPAT